MKKIFAILTCAFMAIGTAFAGDDITISELEEAIKAKKVFVIDVNGTKSFDNGHIPTAIDFQKNKEELASVLPSDKDTLIVAYCGGPKCGAHAKATKAAKKLGYTKVKHLSAGISGWKEAEKEVEKG